MEYPEDYNQMVGVLVPKILLPRKDVEMYKWAVVACDQYTSEPDYWDEVSKIVGNSPSSLNIILPEVYLKSKDKNKRIKKIIENMNRYSSTIFDTKKGFIYVDRRTPYTKSRKGLIVALDLERYDYNKGSGSLVRATEGTVVERLPPRIAVRKDAIIELPHIMVLIDDHDRTVIEPTVNCGEKLYESDLMMNGGHITGYLINKPEQIKRITSALEKLSDKNLFEKKYHVKDKKILLFAVGDGNHSLATAKSCWELLKKNLSAEEQNFHPSRFALVELVNIHDEGLKFEPIHRIIFYKDYQKMIKSMESWFTSRGSTFLHKMFSTENELKNYIKSAGKERGRKDHMIRTKYQKSLGIISITNPPHTLPVGTLQLFLDEFIKENSIKIDYIHGDDAFNRLTEENIGFYLSSIDKDELFKTVIVEGALPRKTFSMGEPCEKRYYIECRRIK